MTARTPHFGRPALPDRLLAYAVPLWAEAAALARSVLLARLIGTEELGRTLLLVLTLRLAEMASDLGIERLLIQSPDGDSPAFLDALHGAALLRGLAAALLLGLAALPMLWAFPDGAGVWAFAIIALVPLIRGLGHLDHRRAERGGTCRPMALVEAGSTLAMLALVPPATALLPDHRAIAVVLLGQALAHVALSHGLARCPYAPRLDPTLLRQTVRFGLPLVANAGLMFVILQADRLFVARFYGWAEVAVYGVAIQLALLPAQIAGRAATSLLAPALVRAASQGLLHQAVHRALRQHALLALGLATGFATLAPPVIAALYGPALAPDPWLALALGLAAAARLLRTPHSQLAVVTGRTGDPARANLWRAAAVLLAGLAALAHWPLLTLALAAALGEAAATLRAHLLLRRALRKGETS